LAPGSPGGHRGRVRHGAERHRVQVVPGRSFTQIWGTTRYNFASVDAASPTLTAWNPKRSRQRLGGRAVTGQRHRLPDHRRRQQEHLRRRPRVGDRHAGHRRRGPHRSAGTTAATRAACSPPATSTRWRRPQARLHRRAPDQPVHGQEDVVCGPVCGALTVRNHVAALDPATGVPLSWNPGAGGTKGVLVTQALAAGLGIGGDFGRTTACPTAGLPCSGAPRSRRQWPHPLGAGDRVDRRHELGRRLPSHRPAGMLHGECRSAVGCSYRGDRHDEHRRVDRGQGRPLIVAGREAQAESALSSVWTCWSKELPSCSVGAATRL
jgi:hypothetical protein